MKKNRISGKLDVAKEARRRARDIVGSPPPERVIPDKRRKPPRHKKPIMEEEL
jgi:hypothetical protein